MTDETRAQWEAFEARFIAMTDDHLAKALELCDTISSDLGEMKAEMLAINESLDRIQAILADMCRRDQSETE